MHYSVVCRNEEPFESEQARIRAGQAAFPSFPLSVQAQPPQELFIGAGCKAWNVPQAPASSNAVTRSTIPTLLESGTFDGQTGASWSRYAARTLPNSIRKVFPGQAHGAFFTSPCAASVIVSFFNHPKAPNTRCVASVKPATFVIGPRP
jgi:pimeloyl-ACP methyl ester carboxylesterase